LVEQALVNVRNSSDEEFALIYNDAANLAARLEITIVKPRTVKRSVYRPNAGEHGDNGEGTQSIEAYYRINMFLPLVDGLIAHLQQRFGVAQRKSLALGSLIPANLGNYDDVKPAVHMYASLIASQQQVEGEFRLWQQQWINNKTASSITTAAAAIEHCSSISMPNIRILLLILATLPVTTAEAERVFSKVERTATAARAHMNEERLEAIVMLNTHRNRTPSVDAVVNRFAETEGRRMKLLL
jgi:hypothetical protein